MAEATRLKDIQADLKRVLERLERRDAEYDVNRALDLERIQRLEASVSTLQASPSTAGQIPRLQPPPPPFQVRNVKLDFPRFDGTDVLQWIFKAEQFFNYYATPDDQRLTIASIHLDKGVVPWYQMLVREQPFHSWVAFTRALEIEFGPSPFECPRSTLFKLTQTQSVGEFYTEFTALANRTHGVSTEALLDCFISGLKPEIRRDVLAQSPTSISRAVSLAKLFEEKYQPRPKTNSSYPFTRPNTPTQTTYPARNTTPAPILPTPNNRPATPPTRNPLFKQISAAEMQLRREKGQCFTCNDKFSYTHKCPNRQYLYFFGDDAPPIDDTTELPDLSQLTIEPPPNLELTEDTTSQPGHHLSFNALHGEPGVGTMRFQGTIRELTVQILLDSGSSDNFLQPRVANFLKLPVQAAPNFRVLVGNGNSLTAEGFIEQLPVQVQGQTITLPVYLLPISGADLVLGAAWLATLGPHIADYNALSIKFYIDNHFVTLFGDKPSLPRPAQFHHLRRLHQTDAIEQVYSLQLHDDSLDVSLSSQSLHPQMKELLLQFPEVFATPSGLPPSRSHDHAIPLLEGSNPVKVKPYRYPHSQKTQIELMVQEMLEQGIIQPSTSPFSSPVLLVKKKDGTWRFCTDYRALNTITVKDSFPIPTVDELLDELYGASHFSKLDLRSGYHQILVAPQDRYKTAFRTHQGLYEWLVMPFGLTNAPATFQSLMNQVFQHLLRKCVLVFFDDILVYSPSWNEHLLHLHEVLQLLRDHCLYAKVSKCSFGVTKIDYLGHIVSGNGVEMDDSKVKAVMEWPLPCNIKQLRGFLGLTGYYRRFIKNYALIALPLTALLKKDQFQWSSEATDAFHKLQQAITQAPVLALPNFKEDFVLETDASGSGVGAVLSQNHHPIAFFSKKLNPRMQRQSAYVRELYAITEAMAKFRHYLLGHRFIIRTDQKSLKSLMDQTIQTPEQQNWLHKFLGFDFTIEYKPGRDNIAADALSRSFMMAFSSQQSLLLHQIRLAIQQDHELTAIKALCIEGKAPDPFYTVQHDMLFWKNRLVVPKSPHIVNQILLEYHASPVGGHSGVQRTKARICQQFFWPHMSKDITKFVTECLTCQQAKSSTALPAGLLQPLPIPLQIWEDIAMDFITGLPPSNGFTVIFVVVDRLSKYGHFTPLKSDFDAPKVAAAFFNNIVKLHGIPKSIVSDRDKVFTSQFWQQLFRLSGTTLAMSTAYHPQTDGQSEALNKCLEMYLRCFTGTNPKSWARLLPWAEYWYNTAFQNSIAMTPFKAVYGRDPPSLIRYVPQSNDPPNLQELLIERDVVLQQLKSNLLTAQGFMKKFADKKRRILEFQVGDSVLVKLQPYRQHSVVLRKNQKLGLRYFGPFTVLAKVGPVAYRLQLPPGTKIHPVFHVSLLKPCKGEHDNTYLPLPLLQHAHGPLLTPLRVLQTRMVPSNGQLIAQALIQWDGLTEAEATWEDCLTLKKNYPSLNLEDKVVFNGGGNVTYDKEEDHNMTNSVMTQGQVAADPDNQVIRASGRNRTSNVRMRDFVLYSKQKE